MTPPGRAVEPHARGARVEPPKLPVRRQPGPEIIKTPFHNRHLAKPLYLREVIKWRNDVRTHVVTGPCDFA